MAPRPSPTGSGALLLQPRRRGQSAGPGADREPALRGPATAGTQLLHADLHNHSDLSDAAGAADDAFASLRAAGLDAAALTDHAGLATPALLEVLRRVAPDPGMPFKVITDADYQRAGGLADAADDPGSFTAVRGFEWTTPHLGHVNVWFSPTWTPVTDVGPATAIGSLQDWVASAAQAPGGEQLLAGFNHPGREPLRFDAFAHDERVHDRFVSLEMFNRDRDFLFQGVQGGARSPLLDALDAGWWPGLLGVSDEHTPRWGFEPGRGRGGLWVREWSRVGVREALAARRFFATREPGLRVDVVAAWPERPGVDPTEVAARADAVRMGGQLPPRPAGAHEVLLAVDVDGGPTWRGRSVLVQVLGSGGVVPEVLAQEPATAGAPVGLRVPLPEEGSGGQAPWVVVRIADPDAANGEPGPRGHPANARALAYASPVRCG